MKTKKQSKMMRARMKHIDNINAVAHNLGLDLMYFIHGYKRADDDAQYNAMMEGFKLDIDALIDTYNQMKKDMGSDDEYRM